MPARQAEPSSRQRRTFLRKRNILTGLLVLALALILIAAPGRGPFHMPWKRVERVPVSVLVYMIGSDLETLNGAASADLEAMRAGTEDGDLTVRVLAGGAAGWQNEVCEDGLTVELLISGGEIRRAGEPCDLDMGEPETLAGFLKNAAENAPADRTFLFFWDHGGGVYGFGKDDLHDGSSLSLSELKEALAAGGIYFDFIGFDACLMQSVEAAASLCGSGRYMLASEENEAAGGWDYTGVFRALSADPALSGLEAGRMFIEGYDAYCAQFRLDYAVTLSLVDLTKVPELIEALDIFYDRADQYIRSDPEVFSAFSRARSAAFEPDGGLRDEVDLVDLLKEFRIPGATDDKREVLHALREAVVLTNRTRTAGVNGLAAYFPYRRTDLYPGLRMVLADSGYQTGFELFDSFTEIMDRGYMLSSAGRDYYTFGELSPAYETEDGMVQPLSEKQERLITDAVLNVRFLTKDARIDMGSDNVVRMTENHEAVIDFDGSWASIAGQPVALTTYPIRKDEDGYWFSGSTKALLNGTREIRVEMVWGPETEEMVANGTPVEGRVAGYRLWTDTPDMNEQGYRQFAPGDTVEFLYSLYNRRGYYREERTLYPPVRVTDPAKDLAVGYVDVTDRSVEYWLTFTDIYRHTYDTVRRRK